MSALPRSLTGLPFCGAALLGLAACVDPNASACTTANRDINLANLAGNSLSGAYDQCLSDLRSELAGLQLQSRLYESEAARLNAQAASLDGERRAAAQRLSEVNARQAALMREIGSEDASGRSSDSQLQSLLSQEEALRRDIEQQNRTGGADEATANRLLERQQRLNGLAQQIL